MNRYITVQSLAALTVGLLCVTTPALAGEAKARDQLPLGHPDFYPSPRRPIGWRGDGNGAFPGATLAVDRFGDGRMQTAKVKDKKGKTRSVPYVVGDSLNIAWKHPLPGFTMSQPIIVGDRVIQTCEPRTVLCLELKTGKALLAKPLKSFGLSCYRPGILVGDRLVGSYTPGVSGFRKSKAPTASPSASRSPRRTAGSSRTTTSSRSPAKTMPCRCRCRRRPLSSANS